ETPSAAGAQPLERLAADAELARAAHEPRLDARQPSLRPAGGQDGDDRPRRDGLALPLQVELLRLAPLEETLHRAVRCLVDEHGARLGGGLETRRDVDGVAERCVLDARARAHLPHHHTPPRPPHPDTETPRPPPPPPPP